MKNLSIVLGYPFCWGVGMTLAKLSLSEISATTLLIIQLLSSVLFLCLVCYFRKRQLPLCWKNLQQGIAGIFEPALAYMFGTIGLSLTTASNASLISSTEVVLTILFAALFLKEKLTSKKLLLATISFSGVFLLMGANFQNSLHSSITGDLLVLLGTIFAVVYVLFSKTQVSKINPLELTASQQLVGLIATVICFSLFSLVNPNYEVNAVGISLPFWLLAIVSGIMQYALAFLLYLTALQTVQVSHAAFYLALIPVFGVASAILLLGEQPSLMQWLGAFLVIASSYSANTLRTN
jgi:drug/metabolite transporter (DMT)-like permease